MVPFGAVRYVALEGSLAEWVDSNPHLEQQSEIGIFAVHSAMAKHYPMSESSIAASIGHRAEGRPCTVTQPPQHDQLAPDVAGPEQ